jgi:hypothetical protein
MSVPIKHGKHLPVANYKELLMKGYVFRHRNNFISHKRLKKVL